ncbi:MAG: hypothetical protein ACOZNI_08000, partial [Myxococcota bacterium]
QSGQSVIHATASRVGPNELELKQVMVLLYKGEDEFAGRIDAAGAAALALAALPVLRGVAQRIVPFFAWTHAFGARPRHAPPVASLVPAGLARAQAIASVAGGALLVATRLDHPGLAGAAAGALLAGALLHLAVLAVAIARVARHTHRRQALAGTEA